MSHTLKFNLSNFRYIRNSLTTEASKTFLNAMIFSHFSYCLVCWSQANKTTLKPLESLYKQAVTIFDKKPKSYHHCKILSKHNMLNLENFIMFSYVRLIFKITKNAAPPPLKSFIQLCSDQSSRVLRSVTKGHCSTPKRDSVFAQTAFSYRAIKEWNKLPKELTTCSDYKTFSSEAKQWILSTQTCTH